MKRWQQLVSAVVVCLCGLSACQNVQEQVEQIALVEEHSDPHTYSDYTSIGVSHLDLDLSVDFTRKVLSGSAQWTLQRNNPKAGEVIFDTYDLEIDSVILDNGLKALYSTGKPDKILGAPLTVKVEPETRKVTIYYKTAATATALQWLEEQQTAGKKHPFLYTQGESVYTRSWIPCQDGPAVRFTYTAVVRTPPQLMALMSADNPKELNKDGIYHFAMQQPVPAYLVALAVGDLAFLPLNEQMGVYAEPVMLKQAVAELQGLDRMMNAAVSLYGPYDWGRYDVLFLPSGFPFGGMENPRLTFSTPTILTGDRSLVNLIAHELAHSWSGNLVTNATWNDFWLNESFTVYFERRIMEVLEGREYAAMLWDLGLQDLRSTIGNYQAGKLPYTRLKLDLRGQDPDLGLTDIAYEKGAALLLLIEQTIGREALDSFINGYFAAHRFRSVTTDAFVRYVETSLFSRFPQLRRNIAFDTWIYKTGLPDNCPEVDNPRFRKVDAILQTLLDTDSITKEGTSQWSTHEWLYFLRALKDKKLPARQLKALDVVFGLSESSNAEIATVWFTIAIAAGYEEVFPNIERFLQHTGRMKFLEPVYEALYRSGPYKDKAVRYFNQYRANYHPLAQKSVAGIIGLN